MSRTNITMVKFQDGTFGVRETIKALFGKEYIFYDDNASPWNKQSYIIKYCHLGENTAKNVYERIMKEYNPDYGEDLGVPIV